MEQFTIKIEPTSPFQTPIQSDTLFGHICWAWRYLKGENELKEFLDAFNEKNTPVVISSGFPEDYLPMPFLRPLTIDEEDLLFNKFYKSRLKFVKDMKELKKTKFVKIKDLQIFIDNLSYLTLYETHLNGGILLENPKTHDEKPILKSEEVWHNAKNRLSDKVIEGKLFAKEDFFYADGTKLNIYVDDSYFGTGGFNEVFAYISKGGYGADKSSGRGSFEFQILKGWNLPESENPNAFMSLSNYYPIKRDFEEGIYETFTKFGKLGGHWASGIDGGPFKMPLLMLTPGSVFKTAEHKGFYGALVRNVHKKREIVHYGVTLPLKVRVV